MSKPIEDDSQPFCNECQQYQLRMRPDGLMPNHRDSNGEPCPGSRKAPEWRVATKVRGEKRAHTWRWLGSNGK